MVEGDSARLGETDLVGVAVTAVDTMALAVAQASTATAMVSIAPQGSTLVAVEVSTLAVRGTSWLESLAARLEMIGTMVKGSTLMRNSELILDSSIEVRTSIIIIVMEYRNNGGGNSDPGIQSGASLAGISPDLIKEAMQGVVAALAAAAQRGGAEGVPASVLGDAVSVATQSVAPVVQQSQSLVTGSQQAQPMQLDAATVPKQDAPNPAKKAKKADKNPCFRCKQPGHQIDTCTTPVCDIFESPNHISRACPLLQAPKPSVTMYGYAIEQLMFFELPTGGTYKPKVDNVKLVKVTIEGHPMSIPEIAECLRRIVLMENFQWEIYNFQNNVFRVKFPNKFEAQRMKTFRTYPVPDRASDLIFEDWSALEDPLYMLPEVWLRVRGIPADVRTDFLSLWAVGTLFGKTKEVDMIHTRKNKELRLQIGCLDHTLIPETTDVFIQRGFFKLSFEVEPVTVTQLGNDDMGKNGDNNGGGDNNGSNGDKTDGANDMDIEKTMNNEQQGNANSQKGTVKKVNNAKSVVGHQVQHQFEAPILIGSLNTVLLNKEKDREGSPFQADSAPGSVKIRSAAASGLERAGAAGPALPLGSQAIAGQSPVGAASMPGAVSPRTRRPRSPLPPVSHLTLPATEAAAAHVGCRAPAGARGVAAVSPGSDPEKIRPAPPVLSQVTPMVVGPGTDYGRQRTVEQLGSHVVAGFGSSVDSFSVGCSVASRKNTSISIVVDIENSPSPTVVTRQFSGTPTATVTDLEGRTKKTPLVNDVEVFGGIAAPSLSVRASDRIRAQPNADATQMERAMQNVNFRHDFTSPGNGKSKLSIASLSDEDILVKASHLGISLGKNKKEVLKAVESIKEVNVNRTLVILKKNVEAQLDKEEGQNSLLTSKFSSLTGDLIIEEAQELLEQDDLLMPIIELKKSRKKKDFDLSGVRRSARFKKKISG
ncbi:hypothetical protein ACQ4PT_010998 [Festuca glaucescens]